MTVSDVSSTSNILSADQLLQQAKDQLAGTFAQGNGLLSPQQLLQRALDRANGIPVDTVQLSQVSQALTPVDKLLQAADAKKQAASASYTDQDWYITAKVSQLKQQISLYSTLPGLDPSGSIMDDLTKQVNDLVTKQNAKIKAAQDKQAALQKQATDAQNALTNAPPSATDLLNNLNGTASTSLSSAVQSLLQGVGATVNTTA